ncbi:MAG: FKBP-type peptidyl-prolyl cis-trans isomerase [Bacteroidales bacterium]|nr:FKBP-type peptidyl-prolyl cis-trans isomerase [Bacteroidales bacterium]MCF8334654.1 FKBP-type peptidyl-prolyl cis-trans isomerase [Bacteroidales bacterium]
MDKLSYGLGVSVGANLKQQGFNPEIVDDFVEGLRDYFEGRQLKVEEKEVNRIVTEYFEQMQKQSRQEKQEAQKKFFEQNALKEEVQEEPSGLQYEILNEGEGQSPKSESTVKVHYHGTFLDGRVFDSSIQRGKPVTFPLNGVIKGWKEALLKMKPGSKWKLYVPSKLAYGEQGAGNAIPPDTPLIFEVELLEVVQ